MLSTIGATVVFVQGRHQVEVAVLLDGIEATFFQFLSEFIYRH